MITKLEHVEKSILKSIENLYKLNLDQNKYNTDHKCYPLYSDLIDIENRRLLRLKELKTKYVVENING